MAPARSSARLGFPWMSQGGKGACLAPAGSGKPPSPALEASALRHSDTGWQGWGTVPAPQHVPVTAASGAALQAPCEQRQGVTAVLGPRKMQKGLQHVTLSAKRQACSKHRAPGELMEARGDSSGPQLTIAFSTWPC